MTKSIRYIIGDATDQSGERPTILMHVVNTAGGWGAGFTKAVSARWPFPEREYRKWYSKRFDPEQEPPFKLGRVQFIPAGGAAPRLVVANMLAQDGYAGLYKPVAVNYTALKLCLSAVANEALNTKAEVCCPRIGCGLGGGSWDAVEKLIERELCDRSVEVRVHDLPEKNSAPSSASASPQEPL
jgi:O-acetyl-ADP-ribose deacetylase (regulator of RNase III)